MKQKLFYYSVILTLALVLSACAPQASPATEIPQASATTGPTEAVTPAVEIIDQEIVDGSVTVPSVSMAVNGWVVIHASNAEGKPGAVIGYSSVPAGLSNDVKVSIETENATPQLYAMLHIDAGTAGIFDFPGEDIPVKNGETIVMEPFNLTGLKASVSVSDQSIKDSSVMIDSTYMLQPGWVVIHTTNAEGKPGPVIGHAALPAGLSQNVAVSIQADQITPQLFAMLHIDAGISGTYEFPGEDIPVKNGETIVMEPFKIEDSATSSASSSEVAISNFSYVPNELQVKVGTTVTWTNNDSAAHTVTADNGAFDSGSITNGGTFSFTFTEVGSFSYICTFHPRMTGVVTVVN